MPADTTSNPRQVRQRRSRCHRKLSEPTPAGDIVREMIDKAAPSSTLIKARIGRPLFEEFVNALPKLFLACRVQGSLHQLDRAGWSC
jgi:hypothetical protein